MNKNLSFESFLGELSAELVNLPLESIDGAIESSIKSLVEFFGADRCHLGEFSEDKLKIEISYFHTRPGINIPQTADVGEHYLSFVYESIKQDQFEIDRSWIELTHGKLYLDELYGRIEKLESSPFVILNMCESAQVTPSLSDSFIHFFIDRGARGVIGTECPMTLEFAHPFAEQFLGEMIAGTNVGVALLNARRRFLEFKNPLGLAYTLFGSATVCF